MNALGSLAWISGEADRTVLPVGVLHELALEVEGVVDGCETEVDVVALEIRVSCDHYTSMNDSRTYS